MAMLAMMGYRLHLGKLAVFMRCLGEPRRRQQVDLELHDTPWPFIRMLAGV